MSFNFNGVNKNKVYMNGVEVTKAYMNGVEFYTSDAVYKLNFDSSNQDYLSISALCNSVGDFFEQTFTIPSDYVGDFQITNDNLSGEGVNLRAFDSGFISLRTKNNTNNLSTSGGLFSFGDTITVKIQINSSNGCDLYLNGVNYGSTSLPTDFTANTIFRRGSLYSSGTIKNIVLNSESFSLSEGSGNTITGDSGTIGTINTSNAAGIAYINANVWEEIV